MKIIVTKNSEIFGWVSHHCIPRRSYWSNSAAAGGTAAEDDSACRIFHDLPILSGRAFGFREIVNFPYEGHGRDGAGLWQAACHSLAGQIPPGSRELFQICRDVPRQTIAEREREKTAEIEELSNTGSS